MFIQDIEGQAINVAHIIEIYVDDNSGLKFTVDARTVHGGVYELAEDQDQAVAQEFLDDLVTMINIESKR